MSAQDDGYEDDVRRMNDAASRYTKAHPFATVRFRIAAFEADVAEQAGKRGQKPAIIAALASVIDRVADSADARALLQAMVTATDGRATYLQAKHLIEAQQEAALRASQGQMEGSGDWHCPCCGALLDGYTNIGSRPGGPTAGSFSFCAYCYALFRIAASGDRYVATTLEELRDELHSADYKALLGARRRMQEAREREAARRNARS